MRILVTGSNRGLGFEFVRQYLELGNEVIGTCRTPENADSLQKLKSLYGDNLTIIQLDVSDIQSIQKTHDEVTGKFNSLDIIINNAGIISGDEKKEYNLGNLYQEDFMHILNVNSVAPLLISEQFLDLLSRGMNPKVLNISSRMGSIGEKTGTSHYSYCMSKAALNMASKLLANNLEARGIGVWVIHPGWNRTNMGGQNAPLDPKDSVTSMIKLLENIAIRKSGKFLNWDGTESSW